MRWSGIEGQGRVAKGAKLDNCRVQKNQPGGVGAAPGPRLPHQERFAADSYEAGAVNQHRDSEPRDGHRKGSAESVDSIHFSVRIAARGIMLPLRMQTDPWARPRMMPDNTEAARMVELFHASPA